MELKDIREFFEKHKDNEEVRNYLGELKNFTLDDIKNFLNNNEDGKKYLQSHTDSTVTKAIETYKQKTLPSVLEEEIKRRFPAKTDSEIELENIKAELAKIKADKLREELVNKSIKLANTKKLPLELVDYFVSDDSEENTIKNIEKFEQVFNKHIQVIVDERLKGNSYTPPGGNKDYSGVNPWKKETFNLTMQAKILKENPELAKKLQVENK